MTALKAAVSGVMVTVFTTVGTKAITITDFVETLNSISFNFAGNGTFDFVISPPNGVSNLVLYWSPFRERHDASQPGVYSFEIRFQHLLDGGPLVASVTSVPYGTTGTADGALGHRDGVDFFSLSITVHEATSGVWGPFSGSFSARHEPPLHSVQPVPDSGSTAWLAFLGLLGLLVGVRPRSSK